MTQSRVSVVLPFSNQADAVEDIVRGHIAALGNAGMDCELLLVPNGSSDDTTAVCRAVAARLPGVRCVEIDGRGWGRAVRAGIAAATGETICYTNSARTQPDDLAAIITHALRNPDLVVKATRHNRHSRMRRLGSFLYNALCAALLRLSTRDVNGTPKAFPASASTLRNLQRDDDLIDLEFMWRCRTAALNVVEIPVYRDTRRGRSTTGYGTAWRLYVGAIRFWRQVRTEGRVR
jgi:glycosyltransferase involved in cell wall biosynthesis